MLIHHCRMATDSDQFVLGLDLDGTVADFYGRLREIAAEWRGVPVDDLTESVTYGLPEWGFDAHEYERLHRFAVTQRGLFTTMPPLPGAPQSIRRLGTEGIRIRVITHRLFLRHFHNTAAVQTVDWLDGHAVPYWDLCFMRDKHLVDADIYVEDSPTNILRLREEGRDVVTMSHSSNEHLDDEPGGRARTWHEAETLIRERYYSWRSQRGLELPPEIGRQPPDHV